MSATVSHAAPNPEAANLAARAMILKYAKRSRQGLVTTTFTPNGSNNTLQFPIRNVGLPTGFLIHLTGSINNTSATNALTATPFGIANVLGNVQFQDYSNYQRINTWGWHLHQVATRKHRWPLGLCHGIQVPSGSSQMGFGDNYSLIDMPSTIAVSSSGNFEMWYHVPLTKSFDDLTGMIDALQLQNQATLSLTLNQNPVVASGTDSVLAMYSGTSPSWTWGAVTVEVYQDYFDQLPTDPKTGNYIIPQLDVNTLYELKSSSYTGLVSGQNFPILIPNFREFLSMFAVLDNGGSLYAGTDINFIQLLTANLLPIRQVSPRAKAYEQRHAVGTDLPLGTWSFDFSANPIDTTVFGNMSASFNLGGTQGIGANSVFLVGWEDVGVGAIMMAGGSFNGAAA